MLLNGLEDRLVGDVNAEVLVQGLQHMRAELFLKVLIAVFTVFEGDVGELAEEVVIVDDAHVFDRIEVLLLNVLLKTAGNGASLGCHLGIEEIESSLQCPLQKGTAIVADTAGHVIGRDIRGSAARRSQADGEAAGQVEKYFRHEIASVAERTFAIGFRLLDKVVVGFLKQILKENQMLEISHR